jgi:hypothetical protein
VGVVPTEDLMLGEIQQLKEEAAKRTVYLIEFTPCSLLPDIRTGGIPILPASMNSA